MTGKIVQLFILAAAAAVPVVAAPPMIAAGGTVEIAENIFVIPDRSEPLVPNVGIVVGDDDVLVIDAGMGPANAEIVLAKVREISDLPIRYFVSTHFHPEHNYGAQSFPKDTVILYSTVQHEELRTKGESFIELFLQLFGDDVRDLLAPVEFVWPDVTFEREARVNVGGLPVEVHHLGHAAHTRGDTIVYLPEQRIMFSGGLTPNGFFAIFPDADSSISGWLASLEALEQFDIERLIPGHGPMTDAGHIQTVKEYLLQLRAEALGMLSEDVPLPDAQAALSARFQALYPDWQEPHWIANAVANVYAEAASGG